MAESVVVNFAMDRELRDNAEEICSQMGMSLATALTIFCKTLERERRMPFEITADPDLFYHPANMRYIERQLAEYDAGRLKLETHDLIEKDCASWR